MLDECPVNRGRKTGQEPAGAVLEQRVDADGLHAFQVGADYLFCQRQVLSRPTAPPCPWIFTRRRIALFSGPFVHPEGGIHVFPPPELGADLVPYLAPSFNAFCVLYRDLYRHLSCDMPCDLPRGKSHRPKRGDLVTDQVSD
jgi:hypothetical protein